MTARFLRDDVPPRLAGEVLQLLLSGAVSASREGARPSPAFGELAAELYAASVRPLVSLDETPADEPSTLEWVTVDQAAEALGSSTQWVRRLVADGQLMAQRTGRKWRIDAADLERFRHGRTAA